MSSGSLGFFLGSFGTVKTKVLGGESSFQLIGLKGPQGHTLYSKRNKLNYVYSPQKKRELSGKWIGMKSFSSVTEAGRQ